ncbi:hypothetical protein M413DRAFT_446153 [Hebeloma cylindrosporum]|uniref:Zn(2)-C6 fungal-type domain-containing protein n=1 Tax=Hebeloma cylindrosporum TaxID=76867 RepID=A0A0C2XSU6_HEBCY|nr:hypothetical protein M413DRAFT_446153 [Hebeloma cylindrosporum h7]
MKKRRIQRACDICRRKKIRCDGVQLPGFRCSNCVSCNFDCKYVEGAKKRGPPKGYVERIERRLEKLEKLLRRLCPNDMLYAELNAYLDDNWANERPPVDPSTLVGDIANKAQPNSPTLEAVACAIRGAMEDKFDSARPDPDDDDDPTLILADKLRRMELSPTDVRFFGKSSGVMLLRTAIELKNEYAGKVFDFCDPEKPMVKNQRREFWTVKPWEQAPTRNTPVSTPFDFPDLDLANHCIDLYFKCSNLYFPLLHRPTFDKCVQELLYLTDDNFAPVFLLVCAVGAQYSYDPRVLWDGESSYHSSGWKWFTQVQTTVRSLTGPPGLYDLQLYCLCIQFLLGSSSPQSSWTMVGVGIRLAQDVGAHRRKMHDHIHTPEDELWKRAFWILVCMDRIVSSSLGRASAIQDEDFDLDLPIDCDDEYWDHPDPEKRFKQPPNKPSSVTAFILYIKLQQVLGLSLRTIYAINQSKTLLVVVGQEWEQQIVVELDSALNKWVDSVPDHLRWDPKREDDNFFNQSAFLYATYYYIQIVIHRPFIPSSGKPSPLSFPSLAICTNAARSCTRVLDIQANRNNDPPPQMQMTAFTVGIVLLLSIWGAKPSGLSTDPNKEMGEVHKCMQILKSLEARWHAAGRLWDTLNSLASMGGLPLRQSSPPPGTKREPEADSPPSGSASGSPLTLLPQKETPRTIAGLRRVNKKPLMTRQTEQALLRKSSPQPPPANTLGVNMRPPQQAHSPRQWHIQMREISDPGQAIRATSPFTNHGSPVFALPVYGNEVGRAPVDGRQASGVHAHLSQSQEHSPQMDAQANCWFPLLINSSAQDGDHESTSRARPGRTSSSYGHHSPLVVTPLHQQHPRHHHLQQGIPLASSSSGSSVESAMEMEMIPDRSAGHYQHQHQHQGTLQQHEQQSLPHPFAVDNDIWSNASTASELDDWVSYLSNAGEAQGMHHVSE